MKPCLKCKETSKKFKLNEAASLNVCLHELTIQELGVLLFYEIADNQFNRSKGLTYEHHETVKSLRHTYVNSQQTCSVL